MPEYVRDDGTPAVEPVTKNAMLNTFTDAKGIQVFEKGASSPVVSQPLELGPLNSKLGTLLVQQQVIMNQQAKIMSFFGIL